MFWADKVAQELKQRKLPLEWVDDMKTPSGKIHVGALRGVVIHDLVYKALLDAGVKTKYTYIFDDHDPMDALPVYLSKEIYEKYLGMPLYKVPSPKEDFANYAEYYAQDFTNVFNSIGCHPQILWSTDLYMSGKMNEIIKECLDKTDQIRKIYEELYKKKMPKDWFPFNAFCPKCGKVSATKVYKWDGEKVYFTCKVDAVKWTKGCGHKGGISPFSSKNRISGKLLWKIEWAAKWKVLGVTVEGGGKDHMSKGGSYDLASIVCKKIFNYEPPYPIAYEHFLSGGRKMSSSKGVGSSAREVLEVLPPEILRFLLVKARYNQAVEFNPMGSEVIPRLYDEYQKAADAYYKKTDKDLARIFELSQVNETKKPPTVRFSALAQWVQMPNMERRIKEEGLEEWAKYARIWLDRFAPEEEKFEVKEEFPEAGLHLSGQQRLFLSKVIDVVTKDWKAEEFEKELYKLSKDLGLSSKEAFAAIYLVLLGKDHGPKAAWLILSLDKKFVAERFRDVASEGIRNKQQVISNMKALNKPEIFSIDKMLGKAFPSISVGVAIIKDVTIEKSNEALEKEKEVLLSSLSGLTTEHLGQYSEVISYRKLYKQMAIDWHSRRPSPEALLRRVALHKGLYTINTCVDAYNLVVMRHRVSVGAFDLDTLKLPTVLRFAKEGEEILLLGDSEPTKYSSKEVAYFDQHGGFNIDFNFRDSQKTAVQLTTKNLYINVDGVFDITPSMVKRLVKETCDIIMKYCGGKLELFGVETASP